MGNRRDLPAGKECVELVRRQRLDPVVVLLGIVVGGVGVLLGGSPRILLIRELLFTGAFGLACFGALLLPRPLMFYSGRHFWRATTPRSVGSSTPVGTGQGCPLCSS